MANIELEAYRTQLLNFVYYNFLFGYTLTETMWLNRAAASAQGQLTNVAMMLLCSSTEFICCVGLMFSVHRKKRMHPIFLGNLSLKCFPQRNKGMIYCLTPTTKSSGGREALHSCRTPSVWKVHWPGLPLWSVVKELIWFTISLS